MQKQPKWQLVEFKHNDENGLTANTAPEGHRIYTGSGSQNHFVITTPADYDKNLYGSFIGSHIAEIPIAYQGRPDALANARLIAAAPKLLETLEIAYAITHNEFFRNLFKEAIATATGEQIEVE